jgi:hypothetical protein
MLTTDEIAAEAKRRAAVTLLCIRHVKRNEDDRKDK